MSQELGVLENLKVKIGKERWQEKHSRIITSEWRNQEVSLFSFCISKFPKIKLYLSNNNYVGTIVRTVYLLRVCS